NSSGALTFAFIDPTGIAHAPFELIRKLRQKTRCDLLINIQHAMGIKMNMHQYKPDVRRDRKGASRSAGRVAATPRCGTPDDRREPRPGFFALVYRPHEQHRGATHHGHEEVEIRD